MRKKIYFLVIAMLGAGTFFTSCQSAAHKQEAAEAKVKDEMQDLKLAQEKAKQASNDEEWIAFQTESHAKILANEVKIAELKVKMNRPGKLMDSTYSKKIDSLDEKNKDLKRRMDDYGKDPKSDWETFKREFNHDMNELGNAFRDLTVDNKN